MDESGWVWRGRRAVLVVDLDSTRLLLTDFLVLQTVPTVLRPPSIFEQRVQQARAQEWDGNSGAFRTPTESRQRWRADRDAQRGIVGRQSIHSGRRKFVERELQNRINSKLGPYSAEDALREEIDRGFEYPEVQDCVRRYLAEMAKCARGSPSDPVNAVRRILQRAYDRFRREYRQVLGNYLTEAIYGASRRQVEDPGKTHELAMDHSGLERLARHQSNTSDAVVEDAFLDLLIAEETEAEIRARLTAAESDVFSACMLGGESAVGLAERTGRSPGTVRKQCSDIRRKTLEVLGSRQSP